VIELNKPWITTTSLLNLNAKKTGGLMPTQCNLFDEPNDNGGLHMVNMIIEPFMSRLDAMKDRQEEAYYYDKRQICEMLNEAYFLGRKHERNEWEQSRYVESAAS
jgi:hypothetical protein